MKLTLVALLKAVRQRPWSSGTAMLLAAGALCLFQSCASSSRKNYATAAFRTTLSDGSISIREYPALKVARTSAKDDNGSFMKLFRYIGGANATSEKISMTTPVLMERGTMSFVMPESHQKSAPDASDQTVETATLPARRLAVCSYSGKPDGQNRDAALAKLRTWLESRQMSYRDEPVFAVYDGPFTLPALRLNEVMLPLQ